MVLFTSLQLQTFGLQNWPYTNLGQPEGRGYPHATVEHPSDPGGATRTQIRAAGLPAQRFHPAGLPAHDGTERRGYPH